jgi:hypothetical protein
VLRAVAKDREVRYSNLAEFAEALRPFASEEGQESVVRIAKVLGRRSARSLPPPLPGAPRPNAIVHVAQPAKAPVAVEAPNNGRRWAELALTGAGLAAAGALGVFFAVHAMEGALVAAIAPRAVVADLAPALPASAAAAAVAVAPPVAPAPLQVPAALPIAVTAATAAVPPVTPPQAVRPVSPPPPRRAVATIVPAERAVVADAKPVAEAPARTTGLFDDAN